MFNPSIFKAYDIRGIYGQDFDDDFAYHLGLAYMSFRSQIVPDRCGFKIVVGHDMRLSSPSLKEALIRGLVAGGANVIDIGLVSTPTFYFAVANFSYDGGLMISASHNPGQWNGFKVVLDHARPVSENNGLLILRDKIISGEKNICTEIGKVTIHNNILEEHVAYDMERSGVKNIKPLKIVVDTANGMGAQYLEAVLAKFPLEVIKMNFKLDGTFPVHEADPLKPENLADLQAMVKKEKANLGISTDGDGDRVFFVDNKGNIIKQAIIRGLLAQMFLRDRPGAKIGYDVRPGKITEDMILAAGGIPVVTRVGHSLIKEQMIKENIYFSGESSGHFYLNMSVGCFEAPVIMILKLLEALSESKKSMEKYIAPYEKYFATPEINIDVPDKDKVLKSLAAKYKDGKITKIDGLSVTYPNFWFNVRASNTENKIRVNIEAVDEEILEREKNKLLDLIK
ncbi:MAG: phosphomannomutase/phosphoglucomutase [Candidatus Falkowbacteria bacterium]